MFYKDETDNWKLWTTEAWITLDDSGVVTSTATDANIFANFYSTEQGGTTKEFKLVYTDTLSESENKSVEDLFSLYYTNACEDNKLTVADNFGNPIYQLESGVKTIGSMSITESNAAYECDVTYALYVFDGDSTWVDAGTENSVFDFVHAFDTTTGTLKVDSSDI